MIIQVADRAAQGVASCLHGLGRVSGIIKSVMGFLLFLLRGFENVQNL